ncbi:MAG: hypothetical protein QXX81_08370 [Zestosphaera sp.]
MKEVSVNVRTKVEFKVIKQSGEVVELDPTTIITNAGYDAICDCIAKSPQPAPFQYVAIGTNNTAPAAGQTTLGNEVMRQLGTYSHTAGTKTFSVVATFSITASYTIWESGLFNASSGGTMLCRGVLDSGIPVQSGDTLQVTWTVSFT